MNKRILLLSIYTFFNLFSIGQNDTKVKEHFVGIHYDANFSNIYSEYELKTYDNYTGNDIINRPFIKAYSFGVSYKNFLEKSAGITVELNFVKKGGYNNFLYDTDANTSDTLLILFEQNLEYIEMPVLTTIRIGKKNGRFNIYGGPHIAYLLNQKVSFLENNFNRTYQTESENKFDFGLNAGLGYSYYLGKSVLEFVFKYSHSFSNIYELQTINKAFLSQNQVFSASLYYYFRFKI